jgi:hypothetical protein
VAPIEVNISKSSGLRRINHAGNGKWGNHIIFLGYLFFKYLIFFGPSKWIIENTYSATVVGVFIAP